MKLDYPTGSTPLDLDEVEALIPAITTQAELNELEKANILIGIAWAEKSRLLKRDLLTYSGLLRLHRELFGKVWRWAGSQRKSEKNIGAPPHRIAQDVHQLCSDTEFWIAQETYDWDEIAVRFHHRLVSIHPFVNGNGRLARIAADLLLAYHDRDVFTWGAHDLVTENVLRKRYISALRAADSGDYRKLIEFVRT